MLRPLRRTVSKQLPVVTPDEYRLLSSLGFSTLYLACTKPEIAGLVFAAVALTLLLYQGLKSLHFLGRPNIFLAIGVVLSFLWVLSSSLPAHALLEAVEESIKKVLGVDDIPDPENSDDPAAPLAVAVIRFFTILDLFIVFVLIGSVAFAIYQGSQSNDVRPILFAIAFIVGGIMVLEIGSSMILATGTTGTTGD